MKASKEIELRGVQDIHNSNIYCVEWRIKPDGLNWFKRLFNRWTPIHTCSYDDMDMVPLYINKEVFSSYKELYKTVGDVMKFENKAEADLDRYFRECEKNRYIY